MTMRKNNIVIARRPIGRRSNLENDGLLLLNLAILILFSYSSLAYAAQAPDQPAGEPKIVIDKRASSIPAKEEVKILREERKRKMPYLERGYLKETVNLKAVEDKTAFIQIERKGLNEITSRAIEVYTPVKAARERISLSRRKIMVASREFLPETNVSFELRKGSLSGEAFTGRDYHVNFRQPVFRGGILWNTLRKEQSEYRAAKKEYEAVMNDLVDEVAKAYFDFNRSREIYKDKKKFLEQAKKQSGVSKQKFDQNLISEIEYLNVESLAGQVEYEVETAEQEMELGKLELQRFLDLDVADEIDIEPLYDLDELIKKARPRAKASQDSPSEVPVLDQSLNEFIDLAYQNRPELRVQAEKLRGATYDEKVIRGAFLPRVDAVMEFGEVGEAFIVNADDPTHFPDWKFGLEVSNNVLGNKINYTFDNDENAPSVSQFLQGTGSQVTRRRVEVGILDGLGAYAELKETQVKKLEQVIELEKKEQEVIREVKEAYFDYYKAKAQVASSLKRNQYRQRLAQLSAHRLEKAEVEISEYLQAEIDVNEERTKLHQALADLFKAKSRLNRAIGLRNHLKISEKYD